MLDPSPPPLTEDQRAARRLSHAMESLGETLAACVELPPPFRKLVESLAGGRSTVPVDPPDFVARVVSGLAAPPSPPRAGDPARSLVAWLGRDLSSWLAALLEGAAPAALGFALRPAVTLCHDARLDLVDRQREAAAVYARWYAEGRAAAAKRAHAVASAIALDEAADRWCALGAEGEYARYVATWQRSAAGWADAACGGGVDVSASDLGRLRDLQSAMRELTQGRVPKRKMHEMLASRLGVSRDEVTRLIAAAREASARLDPEAAVQRRWALIRPIAESVHRLSEREGAMPSVEAVARDAGVHPALVELAMEALGR